MARPEKPINAARGEVAKFAAMLRTLRNKTDGLTYRKLAKRTGYSVTQLSQAAAGHRLPTWPVVRAYVDACGGDVCVWERMWSNAKEKAAQSKSSDAPRADDAMLVLSDAGSLEPPRLPVASTNGYGHAGALISLQQTLPALVKREPSAPAVGSAIPVPPPIRIFLVDDHEIVRRGMTAILKLEPDLTIAGEAATVNEALTYIPSRDVDVAILDVCMPDGNGLELCRDLRSRLPSLRCLILTEYSDDETLLNAIMAGASGFMLKSALGNDLISAVRKVGAGESLLDAKPVEALTKRIRHVRTGGLHARLTGRELAVFNLVGEGLTNRQIAARLFLAEKSVKNYVSRILAKLGMQRRTQAASLAADLKGAAH